MAPPQLLIGRYYHVVGETRTGDVTTLVISPSYGGIGSVAAEVSREYRRRGAALNLRLTGEGVVQNGTNNGSCATVSKSSSRPDMIDEGPVALRALKEVWTHRHCCVARADRIHLELGRTSGSAFWFGLGASLLKISLPLVVAAHDVPIIVKHPAALIASRKSRLGKIFAYRVLAPLLDRPLLFILRLRTNATVVLTDAARVNAESLRWPRVSRALHGANTTSSATDLTSADSVVLAGFLGPGKGLDILADAWSRIGDVAPQMQLVIVGTATTASDSQWVAEIANRLNHGPRPPTWRGFVDDGEFDRIVSEAAVVVIPYEISNPASGPLIRALVAGRAIVATRVPAVVDELEDGVSGLLCEPGDANDLARCLGLVMGDMELRRTLGRGAALRGRDHTWPRHVGVFEAAFEALRSRPGDLRVRA